MSRRRTIRGRCPYDHKITFPTFERAQKASNRLPESGTPYWCPVAGGWHVRRGDQADYDRFQALRWSGEAS